MIRRTRAIVVALASTACLHATTQFDRYIAAGQWADAAREFSADSSLRNNEHALYRAGVLYGTPDRSTYDPEKARELLSRLLSNFPATEHREEASSRMMLLDELLRTQRTSSARVRELEAAIAALTKDVQALRVRMDSTTLVSDSLRATIGRLDASIRDRDAQINALKLELQRLKEIDLKPRPPRPPY